MTLTLTKTTKLLASLSILVASYGTAVGQGACSSAAVNSFNATVAQAATCLSNGAIQTTVSNATDINVRFTATPPGSTLTGVYSVGTLGSLKAGTYTLKAYCAGDESIYKEVTVTIPDQYTPISANLSVQSQCSNGAPDATITVNATGGSGMLQYAYWQGASNAADNTLTYGTSATYSPSNFGIYNVRVKDACGEAITLQASVENPYPPNLAITWAGPSVSSPITCAQPGYDLYLELKSNGVIVNKGSLPSTGILFKVYEGACNSANPIYLPQYDSLITPSSPTASIFIPANKQLVIKAITACGDTATYCYNGTLNGVPEINSHYRQLGCNSSVTPTVTGIYRSNIFFPLPLSYQMTNASTSSVVSSGSNINGVFEVSGLEYGASYNLVVTDACGQTYNTTQTIPSQTGSSSQVAAQFWDADLECADQIGRFAYSLRVSGFLPGLDDANTRIRIVGPESVNKIATKHTNPDYFRFTNLLPNTSYTAVIEKVDASNTTSGVCANDTIAFTTPGYATTLQQSIAGTVNQFCSGGGDITLNTVYTGWNLNHVKLINAATGAQVGTIAGGGQSTFTNLPAGQYVGQLVVKRTFCSNFPDSLIISTDTLTLNAAGAGPIINRKIGTICESSVGTPLTTGSAFFSFTGAAPFRVEYKNATESTYTVYDSALNSNSFTISNLEANEMYAVKITDACGNITNDNVEILLLEPVTFTATAQPCVGSTYTLSVPEYGNATYTWKKNGITIATTREYVIQNFGASEAGEYTCEVIIDNCLQRSGSVTLYSQMCGQPITEYTISGNVYNDNNGLTDGKVNGPGTNVNNELFAVLLDASNKVLGSVPVNADGSYDFSNVPTGNYTVVINNGQPLDGTILANPILLNSWVNTGENIGLPTQSGNDGNVDGRLTVVVNNANVTNVNFGIERRPESENKSKSVNGSPVVGVPVNLGDVPMAGSDPEDVPTLTSWSERDLIVTSLPTNGFILKYQGVAVQLGDTIFNYNPSLLTIEPSASTPQGTLSTVFKYATLDSAGVADNTPATYTVTWSTPLPIVFEQFNLIAQGCANAISWTLVDGAQELDYVAIEKATNKGAFVVVAKMPKGSNSYLDKEVSAIENSYRLVAVSRTGERVYSEIRKANNNCDLTTVNVYPNPATSHITIALANTSSTSTYSISNILGASVLSGKLENSINTVDVSSLPVGQYVIRVNAAGETSNHKFSKVK